MFTVECRIPVPDLNFSLQKKVMVTQTVCVGVLTLDVLAIFTTIFRSQVEMFTRQCRIFVPDLPKIFTQDGELTCLDRNFMVVSQKHGGFIAIAAPRMRGCWFVIG